MLDSKSKKEHLICLNLQKYIINGQQRIHSAKEQTHDINESFVWSVAIKYKSSILSFTTQLWKVTVTI